LLSHENGQTSRGSNNIPTRLAPRRTPILYRQTHKKVLLKKGEKITRGGTKPKPSKENKKQSRKKTEEKK